MDTAATATGSLSGSAVLFVIVRLYHSEELATRRQALLLGQVVVNKGHGHRM
jgi:uncharacterized membrane protein YdjX (TVP38/TMEM64 family)